MTSPGQQNTAGAAGDEPLPLHPQTKPLARWIEAIAAWYNNAFGTPAAFAISLLAFIGWIAFIPVLGFSRWNSGPGLLGNTTESTGEWFFGLAVLIVGTTTAKRQQDIESNQHHQMDRIQAAEERNADLGKQLAAAVEANTALTRQSRDLISANNAMTEQVAGLVKELHERTAS